ncbi:MAG TPA: hypothetical protein VGM84_14880 [Steroidobacteraceae bacterium]
MQGMRALGLRAAWVWLLALSGIGPALAADADLTGTWQGKLQASPGSTITIQFIFARKPDGSYGATLNSPDNGAIKNLTAQSVTVAGGTVKVTVPSLSGTYSGTVKGNTIDGTWAQPGGNLPLVLSPYQKPVLSKANIDLLTGGAWAGPLKAPFGTLTFVLKFKTDPKGDIGGTLSVPEQGGQDIPMSDIEFDGTNLEFKIPQVRGELKATYANATFTGTWAQGGPSLPVVLKKGEAPVLALKLSADAFAKLEGAWGGILEFTTTQGQKMSLPTIFRFEKDSKGRLLGFLDSPAQKAKGIPIAEATLTGDKLVMKVPGVGADYSADLKGDTLSGTLNQNARATPLTLKKGDIPSLALKLNADGFAKLAGTWDGTIEVTNPQGQKTSFDIALRFEKDPQGKYFGYLDNTSAKVTDIPITEATVTGDKVVLKAVANGLEFDADLAGKTLKGHWKQGPQDVPVTFTHK